VSEVSRARAGRRVDLQSGLGEPIRLSGLFLIEKGE
jgi:hypothetical protein